jgi:uncharacterized phiE125 gp8 family phage protein
MIYVRTEPPAELAVSLEAFRSHTRRMEADDVEDLLLESYLQAAIEHLDGRGGDLGRCLVDQEWQALADRPGPSGFRIELGPVDLETVVLEALVAGAFVPVDPSVFQVVPETLGEASVVLRPGASWPVADRGRNAWRITFRAGVPADDMPKAIAAAILLLASDLDVDRSAKTVANLVPNPAVERLLAPYRKVTL